MVLILIIILNNRSKTLYLRYFCCAEIKACRFIYVIKHSGLSITLSVITINSNSSLVVIVGIFKCIAIKLQNLG